MKPSGPPSNSIRSPTYIPSGKLLTDAKILQYALAGYYGPAAQIRARNEILTKAALSRRPKPQPLHPAFKLLGINVKTGQTKHKPPRK